MTVTFKEISFEFVSDIVAFNEEPIPLVLWFPTSMIKKLFSRVRNEVAFGGYNWEIAG